MKILRNISVLGLFALISACGNVHGGSNDLRSSGYGTYTDENSANLYMTAAEACSENPNISNQYHACLGVQSASQSLKIYTTDGSTKAVTIFPVANNNGISPFIVNPYAPAATRYSMSNVTIGINGATVSLGNLPVYGIFVVSQAHAAAFANCLASGEVTSCSANAGITYSYGTL